MKIIGMALLPGVCLFLFAYPVFADESLMEAYNRASSSGRYTKYIELDSTCQYIGDLLIPANQYIYLNGRGAVIIGDSGSSISVGINTNLDIQRCVFIGGDRALTLNYYSCGTINNNTIVNCREAAVYCLEGFRNSLLFIWNNIFDHCSYALFCYDSIPAYIDYNNVSNWGNLDYVTYCPS